MLHKVEGRILAAAAFVLGIGSAGCVPVASPTSSVPTDERSPNVVIIFADDLGYGDLGSYGHPTIRTPHLDRMADEGQRWTSFYSQAPVCSPSRAALLTGRIHLRSGMFGREQGVFFPDSHYGLPDDEVTVAEALKDLGYATGIVGKWHLGHQPRYRPMRHGFDSWFGIPYSNDMDRQLPPGLERPEATFNPSSDYWQVPLMRDDRELERPADQTTITKRYTEEAVRFIREHRDAPFFLYVPHTMPHVPLFRSEAFAGHSAAGRYGDVIEEIDWSVGQILDTLREEQIAERTMVIFSSDNGPWLSYRQHGGSAGLLRDGKGTTWEGGMRVPGIFWWPDTIEPGVVQDIGSTTDLFTTILALAGGTIPSDRPVDGLDLSPVLLGRGSSPRDFMAFYRRGELYAFRHRQYKAHFVTQGSYGGGPERTAHDPPLLFYLGNDPGENHDVAPDRPDVVADVVAAADAHRAAMTVAEPLFDARGDVPSLTRNRGSNAADDLSLAEKARVFGVDLAERFIENGQVRVRRRLPSAEHPYVTYNMSDTAYLTGIYCATATWQYVVTRDARAAARAGAAAAALGHLVSVTGRPGLLARASMPADARWFDDGVWRETPDGRYRWRGNVSSDQVDALVFGLYIYGVHLADAAERARAGRVVGAIVDAVVENDYRIIGFDGQPTRWGHYELDYVMNEEPMNALLLLQMVKVAHALTGDPRYDAEYQRLVRRGYAGIGERARRDAPPLVANHSDDVLIALALYPLLDLEHDAAIRGHYLETARRWFRGGVHPGIDVEANPFATFLYQYWTGESDVAAAALEALGDVPLDMKWNPDTIAAYGERFGFVFEPDPVTTGAGDRDLGPWPIGQRGRTWSFLVHNPYRVGGSRLELAPFETSGLDYLASYWFGRAHGFVEADR